MRERDGSLLHRVRTGLTGYRRNLALLTVVLGVCAIATIGCSTRAATDEGEGTGAQAIGGSVGPAPRASAPAPAFELPSLDDSSEVRLADFRGSPVVLNFWASWCAPCRAEASTVNAVAAAKGVQGVRVVGVNIQDNLEDARTFVRQYGVRYPTVVDARGGAAFAYAVSSLPSTYFIDRDGRMVRRWVGPLSEKQLVAFIEELQT